MQATRRGLEDGLRASLWFAFAVIWLGAVLVLTFRNGFAVGLVRPAWLSERQAFAIVRTLVALIAWGWIVPLVIGIRCYSRR